MTQVIGGGVSISCEPVLDRRHAREQDRRVVPGRRGQGPGLVARLSRPHPARVLARHERVGAADRAPRRTAAGNRGSRQAPHEHAQPHEGRAPRRGPAEAARGEPADGARRLARRGCSRSASSSSSSGRSRGAARGALEPRPDHEDARAVQLRHAPSGLVERIRRARSCIVALATAMALPVGILVAIYLNEFARPWIRSSVSLALDVLNGVPGDRDRHLRLRALRRRSRPERLRRRVRARVPDAAARRALDARGARARAGVAARGEPRARRAPLADDALDRPAADARRHRHRDGARGRARRRRDRAAALHDLDRRHAAPLGPPPRAADRAGRDLRAVGVGRPGRSRAGVGRGARPAALHPLHEPHRALARDAQPRG